MFKYYFFVLLLFFSACSKPTPPSPSQKVFDGEDVMIIFALRAEEVGNFKAASELFAKLYQKAGKKEYLYRALNDKLAAKEYDAVIVDVKRYINEEDEVDPKLLRYKVLALLHKKEFIKAKDEALKLVKQTKDDSDYLILAEIYVKLKKYNMAVKYLEGAYSQNYDEKILDRISIILFMNLEKQKEAIAQLETHSRVFGCSERICNRLLSFYSKLNDVDGMLSVYKRFYKLNPSNEILRKIIQIYVYKKDYKALEQFLERHQTDEEMLLELYVNAREYKKASKLAYKLYKSTRNIDYLGQGAIYEYESLGKKKQRKTIQKIAKKLQKVVQKDPKPLYLNYLGYLLIDHDVNVKEGMRYVKRALKISPNSAYYLDSLAWGYYKLGRCKKAYKLFQKIQKLEGGDDKEVEKHYKIVKKCFKKHRKGDR